MEGTASICPWSLDLMWVTTGGSQEAEGAEGREAADLWKRLEVEKGEEEEEDTLHGTETEAMAWRIREEEGEEQTIGRVELEGLV